MTSAGKYTSTFIMVKLSMKGLVYILVLYLWMEQLHSIVTSVDTTGKAKRPTATAHYGSRKDITRPVMKSKRGYQGYLSRIADLEHKSEEDLNPIPLGSSRQYVFNFNTEWRGQIWMLPH